MARDYYGTLGVRQDATSEEIKRAYRKLARELHPDVNPEEGAQERFREVTAAYEVLSDPQKRKIVDMGGDPLGNGLGGPGYSVREKPPADIKYTKYTVAMAKTGSEPAGTSGSQFFVVTAPDAGLAADYAVVGTISKGLDVVDRIGNLGNASEQPTQPVVIQKATVTES